MKKRNLFVGVGVMALTAMSASAASPYPYGDRYDIDSAYGPYLGASAGSLFYKEEGLNTISPAILQFRFGQQFNPFIAIEGRIGTGINGDESYGYHVDVEAVYGGYLKGMVPLGPVFSVYGLAGVGGVQLHRNYPDFHSSDAALSFGFGGDVHLGGGASLNFEWLRIANGTNDGIYDYTADQLTFGLNWKF